ncbi:MAG: hypothetical protein AABW52_03005 [Nanoarchaeota archaeon]
MTIEDTLKYEGLKISHEPLDIAQAKRLRVLAGEMYRERLLSFVSDTMNGIKYSDKNYKKIKN